MRVLDRLKLELSNKKYFEDVDYVSFLEENELDSEAEYEKPTMQKKLLFTVVDILEAVSNDIDKMRRVETEFETTDGASKHMQNRIIDIKRRISTIADPVDPEANSQYSMMFTRQ